MSKKKDDTNNPFHALKDLKKRLEEEERAAEEARLAAKRAGARPPLAKPARRAEDMKPRSDEDEALVFHRMMSGVVPLDRAHERIPRSQSALARSPGAELAKKRLDAKQAVELERDEVHEHLRSLVEASPRFEIADDGRRVEGRRVDLPADALRKLRRGLLPIDARLDLHGFHAGDARAALEDFLRTKRAAGERCVLVVHGKGEHSPGGVGVLRGEVAAWLSQGRASEHVAAFSTAVESDGGEGAVYVLLRNRG